MHVNGGRCGTCGDPWDTDVPRANEAGGRYAQGIISRKYSTRDRFLYVVIQVTSSMGGFFEFNICPNNNVTKRAKEECFEEYPLKIYEPNGEHVGIKYIYLILIMH